MKRALFVMVLAASWLLLLLWAAGADWRASIAPAHERSLPGSRFHAVFGTALPDAQILRVESPAQDYSVLQATVLPELHAQAFPVLRYTFRHFPRTLELSLMFRTAQHPEDVQTLSLPWPGEGTATFDLSQVAAWRGTIIELGFAQFATAQLVPPERGFAPFELVSAQLWSPSWRGSLAALGTDWFGAWPWSQRSVHALGREGGTPRAKSALLVTAIAIAIALIWTALLFGVRDRRLLTIALVCVAVGWFALDLRWQAGLAQRLKATRALYSGHPWPERARLIGDGDILEAAEQIKSLLRGESPQRRILVQSSGSYASLRMIWHLLPLNVAPLMHATVLGDALPEGSLLVFYQDDTWRTDPEMKQLLANSERITLPGSLFAEGFEDCPFVIFRYHHAY